MRVKNEVYMYYQPNKKDIKDEVGDCVLRSICKATKQSWLKVFDELCKIARKLQHLPNEKTVYEEYLFSHDWNYYSLSKNRKTVKEFVKANKGTYILYARVGFGGHLVCADKGKYYDTWDCGKKLIYGYYKRD